MHGGSRKKVLDQAIVLALESGRAQTRPAQRVATPLQYAVKGAPARKPCCLNTETIVLIAMECNHF